MRFTSRTVDDEDGLAFLAAVIVIGVVMSIMATTLFHQALDNVTTSARTVQVGQSLQAAEAGVDAVYQKIASAVTLAAMPCGPVPGTLGSAPAPSTYTVTVKYFATLNTTTTPLGCTAGASSNSDLKTAKAVELTAKGHDLAQSGIVQSEAHIAPSLTPAVFDNAIFITGTLTVSGSNGLKVGSKNVFVRGNLVCKGTATVTAGSVTVVPSPTLPGSGNATLSGHCAINGQLEATGNISITGSGVKITGTVISTTGNITVSSNPTVKGNLYAHGTITYPNGWKPSTHSVTITGTSTTVPGTINQYYTWLSPPANQPFPTINWKPTGADTKTTMGWTTEGYKTVMAGSNCKMAYAAIYASATANTSTGTSEPKAIYTTCSIVIQKQCPTTPWTPVAPKSCTQLALARNLAIVSTAGITMKQAGGSTNVSTTGGKRTLFLIVPTHVWTATTPNNQHTGALVSCSGTNGLITLHGTIGATVNTLVYSPCKIHIYGATTVSSGEIATRNFTANGGTTLGPGTTTVPGSSGGGTKGGNPSVGIIYEREYK